MQRKSAAKQARRLTPNQPRYLHDLLDFVEGRRDWRGRRDWWRENEEAVLEVEGSREHQQLALSPGMGAYSLLSRRGIRTLEKVTDYWEVCSACPLCGEETFVALPGRTTHNEIREFALRSKLEGRDQIAKDGWTHPGRYCPNGCVREMWNIARSVEPTVPHVVDDTPPISVMPYQPGWVLCPNCGRRFSLSNKASWSGKYHLTCGQRLEIVLSE